MKKAKYLSFVIVLAVACNYSSLQAQNKGVSLNEFTGYMTLFHNNGELHIVQKFVDGQMVLQESYFSDGVLKERFGVAEGKPDGAGVLPFHDCV